MSKNNRRTTHENGATLYWLHATNIVTVTTDEQGWKATLRKNGWQTPTTKKAINEVIQSMGWTLYQEEYRWFVWHRETNTSYRFVDDMAVFGDGTVQYPTTFRLDGYVVSTCEQEALHV